MFESLNEELDRLPGDSVAQFWWRDDDATKANPKLIEVLQIAKEFSVPIHLSVIPAAVDSSLVELLKDSSAIVLQHGFSHQNYLSASQTPSEFPSFRAIAEIATQLQEGSRILSNSFGVRFQPVLVPPWSQIRPDLVAELPDLGFIGISSHRARHFELLWPGLRQINTQIDLINWKGGSGAASEFVGAELACSRVASHLAAKRLKIIDDQEPTGILTHHNAHDKELSRFLPKLLAFLSEQQKVRWVAPFCDRRQGETNN